MRPMEDSNFLKQDDRDAAAFAFAYGCAETA